MGYKTLLFSNPCKLRVKSFQLACKFQETEDEISIPLEDISTIVLENMQIEVTNYFLSACGEYNITLFSCDKKTSSECGFNTFLSTQQKYKNCF